MFNSELARRLVLIVLAALLLSALLTVGIYTYASELVFARIETTELMSHAEHIAEMTADRYFGELDETTYEGYMTAVPALLKSHVSVYLYREPATELHHYVPDSEPSTAWKKEAADAIEKRRFTIMDRKSLSFKELLPEDDAETLFVGYPIIVTEVGARQSQAAGSVFLTINLGQVNSSYTSLTFALVLASGLAFLIMIWPLLILIKRITLPLRQTTEVAIAMSRGDFGVRADSSGQGEIGELSRAVNNLASDLDRTLSSLMLERNRLQQAIDGLSEGLVAVSADLTITHWNPAVVHLLVDLDTYDHREEELTDDVYVRRAFSDLGIWSDYIQVMNSRSELTRQIQLNKRIIQVSMTALLSHAGRVAGAVALFRDVTESEQLEQTRREYVANVSHELRTPLTAVRGLVEPLNDGLVTKEEDRQRYYKIILEETLRLSRLISDMLELSRLQAGRTQLKREVFTLDWVTDAIRGKYESIAAQHEVELVLPEDTTIELYWNADRLEQILVILIDNALRFTPPGGRITLSYKLQLPQGKAHMTVADTGSGIAAEDIEHVFERFYKADKSREKREGTGLGLSIASEILHLAGETIWVHSKLDRGAAFTFTVPLPPESIDETAQEKITGV